MVMMWSAPAVVNKLATSVPHCATHCLYPELIVPGLSLFSSFSLVIFSGIRGILEDGDASRGFGADFAGRRSNVGSFDKDLGVLGTLSNVYSFFGLDTSGAPFFVYGISGCLE